jgi:hypothetical protein
MVSQRILQILDQIVFYGLVIAAILIYFLVSRQWALYIIIGMMIFLLISYFPVFIQAWYWIQFKYILSFCKNKQLVREETIMEALHKSPDRIRKDLFNMARTLKNGPLVVFVKRYYIFICKEIVIETVEKLHNLTETHGNIGDVIKELGQRYPFETRLEIEALIARIRELNLKPKKKMLKNE